MPEENLSENRLKVTYGAGRAAAPARFELPGRRWMIVIACLVALFVIVLGVTPLLRARSAQNIQVAPQVAVLPEVPPTITVTPVGPSRAHRSESAISERPKHHKKPKQQEPKAEQPKQEDPKKQNTLPPDEEYHYRSEPGGDGTDGGGPGGDG